MAELNGFGGHNAETDVARLQERVAVHETILSDHAKHLAVLDTAIADMRAVLGTVATKQDIADLRKDLSHMFIDSLRDAQRSLPGKIAAIFGAAMFVVALLGLVLGLTHMHGM